jgi:hypothetical protein
MLDADPNEAAAAPASADIGFDTTPAATVNQAPDPTPAAVETGFGELDGTPAAIQPATRTAKASTGEPEDADVELDARVAALLPNKSITDWNAVSAFMANVVAWPGGRDPGYVNLHYSMPNLRDPSKGLLKGMGWPFTDITKFVERAAWVNTTAQFKDVWFCTSLQSTFGHNTKGKPKAIRLAANALKQKSIWIDCDVKAGDPKHYATEEDALKAILLFAKTVGLPTPSAIVRSGGGLHIYWISKEALSPAEWLPYASGLKQLLLANNVLCDSALTTDIARLLRVPGTLNHKPEYVPPREVTLAPLPLVMYDFAKLDFLKQFAAPMAQPAAAQHSIFADGVTAASFGKPNPFFAHLMSEPGLDAGIDKAGDKLLDPRPIFKDCGFYRDAFAKGGKDHKQDLWMYAILGTTFMENGRAYAHEISKEHTTYTPAETDALYDRKVAERRDRGLGYPQCSTIQGAGGKSCATCPHLKNGKSPLNLGYKQQASRAGATTEGTFDPSNQYEPIELTDPLLAELGPKWLEMIEADDYSADYEGDPSRAEFALVCEAIRVGIDDEAIARLLMDARRQFGAHTRDNASYRLPRIINRGRDFTIDPDLEEMNSKFFVAPIGDATRVVSMKDDPMFPGRRIIGRAQSFPAFTDLHSNKRKMWETVDKDGNSKVTKIPLGAWWLRHERRRQYDGGMAFMPQHDQDHVGDVLNTWRGFAVQPLKPEGSSGASGCHLMLDHIRLILCSGDEEHFDFFMKRLASIIQTRRRTEVALALATKIEGTGKGFYVKHVMSALLGSAHMEISNPEHLTGKHNQHLEILLSLCADEALFAGDPRHRNALYSLITEPMITVEPKFVGAYSAPNHLNIDILSNADHYVPASSSARRFFVPTVSPDRAGDFEYFRKIEAQMKNDGGYEALLYHLQHEIDLRHFDVRKVPTTVGLREQARYSRKGVDLLVETVCNDGRVPCAIDGYADCSSTNSDPTVPGSLDYMLSKSNDRDLQKPLTVKRRLISEWGCMAGDHTRIWNGNRHLACIRWPALSDLRAKFEQRHGPQTWDRADVTEWRELTDPTNIGAAATQAGSAADVTGVIEEFEQFAAQTTLDPDGADS